MLSTPLLARRLACAAVACRPALRSFSAASAASPYTELDESKQKLAALVDAPNAKVLAYFTAAWCGPCKAIAPQFTALAKEHGKAVHFVKIDIDDNGTTAEEVRPCCAREACGAAADGGSADAPTHPPTRTPTIHTHATRMPTSALIAPLQASISSVPTFKSFVGGKPTGQFSGAQVDKLQAAVKALVEAK